MSLIKKKGVNSTRTENKTYFWKVLEKLKAGNLETLEHKVLKFFYKGI